MQLNSECPTAVISSVLAMMRKLCCLPAVHLGPNYGGGNGENGDLLQKLPCMCCYAQCPQPCLQQATMDPCLCWRLLDTHRQVWVSLLWVHCSFLPGSGAQGSVCALQESVSQSCVSSGSSMVGWMVTSSKRAYAIPKSAAPRDPAPAVVRC